MNSQYNIQGTNGQYPFELNKSSNFNNGLNDINKAQIKGIKF